MQRQGLGFAPLPGYSQGVDPKAADNRELVALTFRSLDAAFAGGGEEEAIAALREAFARRIGACLRVMPSPDELKELPEALQQEIREREREAALLGRKREAALQVIPAYSHLLQAYRSYDAEVGSPQRLARTLGMSATTVLVGGVLGYLVERGVGLPYATVAGIGLGVIAFFSMVLQTLGTSRQMTRVESSHVAQLERLKEDLYAAFEDVDRQGAAEGEDLSS
ncbi:MAG: hypothetical protein ACE5IQ_11170 [Candidatus Methylomirabilales bacterium]